MKKLIVAAAIALCAAVSQAAAVTWTVNNIQASPDVATPENWLVQIYAVGTDFSYEAAKAGTITALSSANAFKSGTIYKATETFGNYSAGAAVNTFAVIYDADTVAGAKNYIVSADLNKNIAANGANLTIAYGNMAGTTSANLFKGKEWTATGATPTPEPTSAVLLLLGMAGLALKRKHV